MDELFLLGPARVAMPESYWEEPPKLSSQLLLVQPSADEYDRIEKAIEGANNVEYDKEIFNELYNDTAMVLDHKVYDLITSTFAGEHQGYLDGGQQWDPDVALETAKFLHFSDWPVPKPWIHADPRVVEQNQPSCLHNPTNGNPTDCRNRELWLGFYDDFRTRRKEVCGIEV